VVADNASSSHFLLAEEWSPVAGLCLADVEMAMSVDGAVRQRAKGSAISGDPVLSVVQLCELLAGRGRSLPPGSFVLAGAATVAEPLRPGQSVSLTVGALPSVRVRIES
jgi:2-oxo-3-hexenedioate decarboxylase